MTASTSEAPIGSAIAELRVKWRGLLDVQPRAELVVPTDVVMRKSTYLAIETELLPRDVAFQLIREAIDDAFERGREEGAIAEGPDAGT